MKISYGALLLLVVLYLLILSGTVFSAVINVSWDNNTETDLDGYRVYYGLSSRDYGHIFNAGKENTVEIQGLEEGRTYYFAVTAYDTSGNESDYSIEKSLSIPSGQQGHAGSIIDGSSSNAGSDPGCEQNIPPNPPADTNHAENIGTQVLQYMDMVNPCNYAVKDIITDILTPIDISQYYKDKNYSFYPLQTSSSTIDRGTLKPYDTGLHLFMVIDEGGNPVHILRASIVTDSLARGEYNPDTELALNNIAGDIKIKIPANAFPLHVPIGIGSVQKSQGTCSFLVARVPESAEFDIIPYGLRLSRPASVCILFDSCDAQAERYDDESETWTDIDKIQTSDGMAVFSTEVLGRFRVTALNIDTESEQEPSQDTGTPEEDQSGLYVKDCFCFISTASASSK